MESLIIRHLVGCDVRFVPPEALMKLTAFRVRRRRLLFFGGQTLLESEREGRRDGGSGSGVPACSSHVIDGPRGYPFAVPSMQVIDSLRLVGIDFDLFLLLLDFGPCL